jgi:hypothetical protein
MNPDKMCTTFSKLVYLKTYFTGSQEELARDVWEGLGLDDWIFIDIKVVSYC